MVWACGYDRCVKINYGYIVRNSFKDQETIEKIFSGIIGEGKCVFQWLE